MDTETNTQEAITNEVDVASLDGERNDSSVVDAPEIKDVLGQTLKRNFKTNEEALAAVKNTFSYVGEYPKFKPIIEKVKAKFGGDGTTGLKFMEEILNKDTTQETKPIATSAPEGEFISKSQYEADKFFASKPEYAAHRVLVDALASKTGKPLAEVVEMPELKGLVEKARKHDEIEGSKSVLHTNPKIGVATDKITKARDAQKAGDQSSANAAAVSAVMDAYDLK